MQHLTRQPLAFVMLSAIGLLAMTRPVAVQAQQPLEQRVIELEKRVQALEGALNRLMGSTPERTSTPATRAPTGQMSISLISKRFFEGQYRNQLLFEFRFTNRLQKPVRAFTGLVVFEDLFDREIMRMRITVEDPATVGGTATWSGGIDYNQYQAPHQRLRTISPADLRTVFKLEQVVYQDGTRQQFQSYGH